MFTVTGYNVFLSAIIRVTGILRGYGLLEIMERKKYRTARDFKKIRSMKPKGAMIEFYINYYNTRPPSADAGRWRLAANAAISTTSPTNSRALASYYYYYTRPSTLSGMII